MNCISLYSGADNLGDGLFQSGHNVKLCIEYFPDNPKFSEDACKTIKLNHPDTEIIHGRVGDYLESLPKADIVIGGPPCPEFSRANIKRSFDMCEVNNFWKAVDIVKPKYFLMENVQDVKKKLFKGSYLINCADYGVPQTRLRRIFTNLPLPEPTHAKKPQNNLYGRPTKKWISVKEALNLTHDEEVFISRPRFTSQNGIEITRSVQEPAHTLLASRDMVLTNYPIYSLKYIKEKNPIMYDKHKPVFLDDPISTITAKDRATASDMVHDGKYIRKLTNEELATLQGFRKDFKFFGRKTSVRRQIGNAVPAAISKAFFTGVAA